MWFSCRCWLRVSSGPPAANVLQQVGPLRRKILEGPFLFLTQPGNHVDAAERCAVSLKATSSFDLQPGLSL